MEGTHSPAAASAKGPIPGTSQESAALFLPLPFLGHLPAKRRMGQGPQSPRAVLEAHRFLGAEPTLAE